MQTRLNQPTQARRTTRSPAARGHLAEKVHRGGSDFAPTLQGTAAHALSAEDVLFLQRTIGNQATSDYLNTTDHLQRLFVGDIAHDEVDDVIDRLGKLYPDQKGKISKIAISKLRGEPTTPYNLAAVADALGIVAADTANSSLAPSSSGPSSISNTGTATLEPKNEVVISVPKLMTSSPQKELRALPSIPKTLEKEPATQPTQDVEPLVIGKLDESTGTDRAFDKESLQVRIVDLYKKTSPQKNDFMLLFKALYHKDCILVILQSQAFAYGFQDLIRSQVKDQAFKDKTEITDLPADDSDTTVQKYAAFKMGDITRWKLRHYSDKGTDDEPPPFTVISSTVSIPFLPKLPELKGKVEEKKKKSGHTGDRDWNRYGNTGNTFFTLCVDNQLYGKQEFLKNTNWYVEFDFDLPSLWISSDWLDEHNIKGPALRGRGRDVHRQLLKLVGNVSGAVFETNLVALFHNLEVKVPGPLSFASGDWKKR